MTTQIPGSVIKACKEDQDGAAARLINGVLAVVDAAASGRSVGTAVGTEERDEVRPGHWMVQVWTSLSVGVPETGSCASPLICGFPHSCGELGKEAER